MNQHEACKSCQPGCGWELSLPCLIWFTVFLLLLASVPGKLLQLGKKMWLHDSVSARNNCLTLFLHNFSLQPHHWHPPTRTSIHPPARRLGGASVISGCHFMRAIIKGSCLVSVETAHFRGGRSEEACVRMLRVTMETGATAYISIHCMRLFHQGTFHHIINAQSVCSLLPKITTMSFQVAGSGTATVKVRLISLPIKPSLCMEQLSSAISKVTREMILLYFPKKSSSRTLYR